MDDLEAAVRDHRRIHFIGIGGVMMSSLALELRRRGAIVTGNDRSDSPTCQMLRDHGIPVEIGHAAEYVEGAAAVVRNAAIRETSPDLAAARQRGIPVFERPDVLGHIMRGYGRAVGVAGTHGKSTVSGMLTHALRVCGQDPTAFLGATLPEINGMFCLGKSDWFVAESCEYCEAFLYLHPDTAVILNVEEDHLDYYSGIAAIIAAFRKFACNTPVSGHVVVNGDDSNALQAVEGIDRDVVTFGLRNGRYRATDLQADHGKYAFTLTKEGTALCRISLSVFGLHNVYNALAAAAVMDLYGLSPAEIEKGLSAYEGVVRRFQYRGSRNGWHVIDDYAHHPDELAATLSTAKTLGYERVICLFQPHTYSRTALLQDRFAEALALADVAVLTDIYAAREQNTYGIQSGDLAKKVNGAYYAPSLEEAVACVKGIAKPGDLILTCGAGSVDRTAGMLLSE